MAKPCGKPANQPLDAPPVLAFDPATPAAANPLTLAPLFQNAALSLPRGFW
jgi:hypothetical protein